MHSYTIHPTFIHEWIPIYSIVDFRYGVYWVKQYRHSRTWHRHNAGFCCSFMTKTSNFDLVYFFPFTTSIILQLKQEGFHGEADYFASPQQGTLTEEESEKGNPGEGRPSGAVGVLLFNKEVPSSPIPLSPSFSLSPFNLERTLMCSTWIVQDQLCCA